MSKDERLSVGQRVMGTIVEDFGEPEDRGCVGRLEYPFAPVALLTLRALAVDSGCALLACGTCLACCS